MAISSNDRAFMEEVAEYFRGTRTEKAPEGSIRDTAIHFGINRTKIRKMLITTGDFSSEVTRQALALKDEGLTNREIAARMKMSESTISTYLPYDKVIHNSPDASEHAMNVRGYRAYERAQRERQERLKERKGDVKMGMNDLDGIGRGDDLRADRGYPLDDQGKILRLRASQSAQNDTGEGTRNGTIEEARNDKNERRVMRLHLELMNEYADERDRYILEKYGKVRYGDNISRDIVVPADMPLYALHFAIQPLFGWQNSHLHEFLISEERSRALTNDNASMWSCMVGVLFRSPMMNEDDQFWADDYEGGSVKKWFRSKYTGPYQSLCYGEGLISCQEDMMRLDMEKEYYVAYAGAYNFDTDRYDGEEYICNVSSVIDYKGNVIPPPEKDWSGNPVRVEKRRFEGLPVESLIYVFDIDHLKILERLPISAVLGTSSHQAYPNAQELYDELKDEIHTIIEEQNNTPEDQVIPMPFTDRLIYKYDFGDGWTVRISASEGCDDLVKAGRVKQKTVEQAVERCRECYRPVLVAKDGEFLMDDVGGMNGFINFLEGIHPDFSEMTEDEREDAERERDELLDWAEGQGWRRNARVRDVNLL